MNFSLCFLDRAGRTLRSELLPFGSDGDAERFAKGELPDHAIVEVWKGNELLTRLFRDVPDQSKLLTSVGGQECCGGGECGCGVALELAAKPSVLVGLSFALDAIGLRRTMAYSRRRLGVLQGCGGS